MINSNKIKQIKINLKNHNLKEISSNLMMKKMKSKIIFKKIKELIDF